MVREAFFAMFLCATSSAVEAGNVYKCKDAAGNTTYQEVPCAKADEQESHRVYERVRDTPEQTRANFRKTAQHYQNQVAPEPAYDQGYAAQPSAPQQRRASQSEIDAVMQQMQSDLARKQTASQRRATAAMYQQQLSAMTGTAPVAPVYDDPPPPPQQHHNVGPTQIRDQHGNTYTQPPGSSFVRDDRTGKQCFKHGDFIQCD